MKLIRIAVGLLVVATSSFALAQSAKPACSLLTKADVQVFAGSGAQVNGGFASSGYMESQTCVYWWMIGTEKQSLDVSTVPAAKRYPDSTPESINYLLKGERKDLKPTQAAIPGVGEIAIYENQSPRTSTAIAHVKGMILRVEHEGPGSATRKDALISVLKTAASRL
jgi:hypothetical protein